MAADTWAISHAPRIFAVSKRFVKFLWEMRLIELPRNLESKALSFRLPLGEIEVFTGDELHRLYRTTGGVEVKKMFGGIAFLLNGS